MSNEPNIPYPGDKALEQLVFAIVLHGEMQRAGYLDEVLKVGAGAARISVEVDLAYRDLVATIRAKARRAGIIR